MSLRAGAVLVLAITTAIGLVPAALGGVSPQDSDRMSDGATSLKWREEELAPPARASGMMAYDSHDEEVVLFGGFGWDDGTWTWDGRRWRQLDSGASPEPRVGAAMAYDPIRDEVVLFGGLTQWENTLDDTWVLADGEWTLRSPPAAPDNASDLAMAFDPHLQQLVMTGAGSARETWTWDGTTWTELDPATEVYLRGDDLVFDPLHNGLVQVDERNGSTWLWNGVDWSRLDVRSTPSDLGDAEIARLGRHVVLFGGLRGTSSPQDETWVLRRHAWRQVSFDRSPPARWRAMMMGHEATRSVVLFGGAQGPSRYLWDTWTLHR